MIKTRLTKSVMENEEGMIHLWIKLLPISHAEDFRVQITLPSGVHRLNNLSGYDETNNQEMVIPNPSIENNVIVEIFTKNSVMVGEKTIIITVTYSEKEVPIRVEHDVLLSVVSEEEMDGLIVDEEASAFIKEHLKERHADEQHQYEFSDHSQTKVIRIDSKPESEWEKKYRIEGGMKETPPGF